MIDNINNIVPNIGLKNNTIQNSTNATTNPIQHTETSLNNHPNAINNKIKVLNYNETSTLYSRIIGIVDNETDKTKIDQLIKNIIKNGNSSLFLKFNDDALKALIKYLNPKYEFKPDERMIETINNIHPKLLDRAMSDNCDFMVIFSNDAVNNKLKAFTKFTPEMAERLDFENQWEVFAQTVYNDHNGYKDLVEKTDIDTYKQLSTETITVISSQDNVPTTSEHIKSTIEYFKTPKYHTLVETLKSKCPNIDEDFEATLQAALISKTTNPDDILEYVQNLDFDKLCEIAPRVKKFKSKQMMEFLFYHSERNTEINKENLTYSGHITHDLKQELVNANKLSKLLSIFPCSDRRIGHIPSDFLTEIPKENQRETVNNIYSTIQKFIGNPSINLGEELSKLLNKKINVVKLGSGEFGTGYKISIENGKTYVLKLFKQPKNTVNNIHGGNIEPQNALYAQGRSNNFAQFYFGNLTDSIDNDGFMITEFLSDDNIQEGPKHLEINRLSSSDADKKLNHNYLGGKLIDYGEMYGIDKELLDNDAVAQYTRIICNNLIQSRNETEYSFNEARLNIIKDLADKADNPSDIISAIKIIEKYGENISPQSLKELEQIKLELLQRLQ